jgi:hypothetical protein
MQNVFEGKGRSLRRRRRARWIVALALLLVALAIAALQIARVAAERKLSAALGTPVTIGTVWWLPWNGTLTANRVTIGSGEDQITARRVAALINPFRVSRDDVAISRVDIDAPAGPVEIDDQYGSRSARSAARRAARAVRLRMSGSASWWCTTVRSRCAIPSEARPARWRCGLRNSGPTASM